MFTDDILMHEQSDHKSEIVAEIMGQIKDWFGVTRGHEMTEDGEGLRRAGARRKPAGVKG